MDVTLVPITRSNFEDVIALELEPEQERNLPSNMYSIAESTLSATFYPRAICLRDVVVGFAMYQFGEIGDDDEGECTIWRFMIDRQHQNTGIGKRALPLLITEIKAHGRCHLIEIYYDPKYAPAQRLYAANGFEPAGFRDDGDVIAELPVT